VGGLDQPAQAVRQCVGNENLEPEEQISSVAESHTMTADDFVA